jgi:hypothetical protein
MKKILLSTLTFIFTLFNCYSQDVITKKTGEDIKAKILEITSTEVKYKRFDNLIGPIYSINKSEVLLIKYENGTNVVMNPSIVQPEIKVNVTSNKTIDLMDALKKGSISNLVIEGGDSIITITITISKSEKENSLNCIIPTGITRFGFIENGGIKTGGFGNEKIFSSSGTSFGFFSFVEVDNLDNEGFSIAMDESIPVDIPTGEFSKKFTGKGKLKIDVPAGYSGFSLAGISGTIISGKITVKKNGKGQKDKGIYEIQYGNMNFKNK